KFMNATVCAPGRSTLANVVLIAPKVATLSAPFGAVLLVQFPLLVQVPLPLTPHCESTSAGFGTYRSTDGFSVFVTSGSVTPLTLVVAGERFERSTRGVPL